MDKGCPAYLFMFLTVFWSQFVVLSLFLYVYGLIYPGIPWDYVIITTVSLIVAGISFLGLYGSVKSWESNKIG